MMIIRYIYGDLYVGTSSKHPFRRKLGVSSDTPLRWYYINASMKGKQEYVYTYPVFFPYFFEDLFHSLMWFLNKPLKKGSGKTEWFAGGDLMEAIMILYIRFVFWGQIAGMILLILTINYKLGQ